MPDNHLFNNPRTVTQYYPTYLMVEDGHLVWDDNNTANVIAELLHVVDRLRGGVCTLKVAGVFDGCKIDLIKRIRTDTGMGLKESKDIADGTTFLRDLTESTAKQYADNWGDYADDIRVFDSRGLDVAI